MINTDPDYFGALLCGSENRRSVAGLEIFDPLVKRLLTVFEAHSMRTRCRGRIKGHLGKNVGPRAGLLTPKMLDNWESQLSSSHPEAFCRFEMFGPNWTDQQAPLIYAAIDKLSRVLPDRPPEEYHAGAGNSFVLAIHKTIIRASLGDLEKIVNEIANLMSAFYGYLNPWDAWDYGQGFGPGRTWLMNYRFRDIVEHKCKRGTLSVRKWIPDLYRGNLLSKAHFAEGALVELAQMQECQIEHWPDDLTYVRFLKDPQTDSSFRAQFEKYFNVIKDPKAQ